MQTKITQDAIGTLLQQKMKLLETLTFGKQFKNIAQKMKIGCNTSQSVNSVWVGGEAYTKQRIVIKTAMQQRHFTKQ